jgi:hypothetical protein
MVRMLKILRVARDNPAMNLAELVSTDLMEILIELGSILGFSFPSSDEKWRRMQETLSGESSFERQVREVLSDPSGLVETALERVAKIKEPEK